MSNRSMNAPQASRVETYQRYSMSTQPDGSIVGVTETNDPEDRGYPCGFDSWDVRCRNRLEFDRRVGRSRVGVNGCIVSVYLDGRAVL